MNAGSITALVETLVDAGATPEIILAAVRTAEQQKDAAIEQTRAKARARVQKWHERLDLPEGEWLRVCGEVYRRDGYRCTYCGTEDGPFHVDHILPLVQGGTNDLDNLTVACRTCNCGKSGRTVKQWRGVS